MKISLKCLHTQTHRNHWFWSTQLSPRNSTHILSFIKNVYCFHIHPHTWHFTHIAQWSPSPDEVAGTIPTVPSLQKVALKGTPSQHTNWSECVKIVHMFPLTGVVWWYYQYSCNGSSLVLQPELLWVQPCWFALYKWRAKKSRLLARWSFCRTRQPCSCHRRRLPDTKWRKR